MGGKAIETHYASQCSIRPLDIFVFTDVRKCHRL